MDAVQLRAEIFREIDLYADKPDFLQQVLNFCKTLTRPKTDESLMSKEDFFKKLDESKRQAEEGKVYSKRDNESFDQFFKRMANVQG
ncbi:MAG: hypothetical protein IKO06_04305 [Alphaproteobacteria bacterium]|nr:hypothetical protein [Alphaproteobacteria bacterium]